MLRDDHITLTANPEYWEEGYPLVDELRFLNVPTTTTRP
jgi:ABC-type transport system substrate-binding protein